jgi:hypothetical protein
MQSNKYLYSSDARDLCIPFLFSRLLDDFFLYRGFLIECYYFIMVPMFDNGS